MSEVAEERISRTSGAFGQGSPQKPPTLRERIRGWIAAPLRDPNPILLKELRATFRTALFIRFLYLSTGMVGLVVLSAGAIAASNDTPPAEVGSILFHVFFGAVVLVLSLVAPAYAAGTITGEKRSGTFESLILSGMSPARIVWGKFVASYASIVLCVIAVAPVVGLAFLFGGISPLAVVTGFWWVLLWLAPAVAFGIALSARLESMWIAIVIAFAVYSLSCMMVLWPMMLAAGEVAHEAWGTPEGPFWFAEAFPERMDTLDGWIFLVLTPLYAFGMPVWFFLASAVAGVQPAAEDRSTHMKIWSVPTIVGGALIAAFSVAAMGTTHEAAESGIVFSFLGTGPFVLFMALLFANEPPLPPRPTGPPSVLARLLRPIGPGAAGTLRFAFLAVVASAALIPIGVAAVRWMRAPSGDHLRYDAALFALVIGNAAIGAFFAALATWLRLVLRNGLAARVLVLAVLAAAILLPFLGALVLDPSSLDRLDDRIPLALYVSPLLPTVLAIDIGLESDMPTWEAMSVVVPSIGYGLLALALWIAVEVRCVQARRMIDERRRKMIARSQAEAAAREAGTATYASADRAAIVAGPAAVEAPGPIGPPSTAAIEPPSTAAIEPPSTSTRHEHEHDHDHEKSPAAGGAVESAGDAGGGGGGSGSGGGGGSGGGSGGGGGGGSGSGGEGGGEPA